MKRGKLFVITLLVLLLILPIYALEIQTEKDQFNKGETFLAKLEGNILDSIEKSDISFLKGHIEIPLTYDLIKINRTYYIYALLKYQEQDLTLKIKDVYYKEQNQYKTSTLEKNFQVTNQTAPFQLTPGFASTLESFRVSVYNNLDNDITLEYKINNNSAYSTIPLQDSKTLDLKIDSSSTNPNFILFSAESYSYSFPVNFLGELTTDNNRPINNQSDDNETCCDIEPLEGFRIFSNDIIAKFNKGEKLLYPIKIKNTGDTDLTLTLSISDSLANFITISKTSIDLINGSEAEVNLTLLFDKTGKFDGFFIVEYNDLTDSIYLNLEIGENVTVSSSVRDKKTCADLNGKKCTICYGGSSIPASDGLCCLGTCEKPGPEPRNWTAVIVIVILLLIIGGFVFFKMRKQNPTARDILRKKTAI